MRPALWLGVGWDGGHDCSKGVLMGLIPDTKVGKIQFYQSKLDPWTTSAVQIGTTAAAMTDLTTKTTAAADALTDQIAKQAAAKTATETLNTAIEAMMSAGSAIIKNIRSMAETTGPSVYELAQIPGPATPAPVPVPGTPYQFKVEILPEGELVFTWKCNNPARSQGTVYQIFRRDTPTAEPTFLGVSGIKRFVDVNVPMGQPQIGYVIQATRSTAVGVAANFAVRFGTTSSGAMTASIVEGASAGAAKLAA